MAGNPWVSSVFRSELAAPPARSDVQNANDELTPLERAFVAHYFGAADRTGTEACRLAGYSGDNATLAVQAVRLKARPRVAAAMEAERARLDAQPEPQAKAPEESRQSNHAASEVQTDEGGATNAPESQPSQPTGIVAPPVDAVTEPSVLLSDSPLKNNADATPANRYRLMTHTRAGARGGVVTAEQVRALGLDLDDLVRRGAMEPLDAMQSPDVHGKTEPASRLAGILARL